jgi:hypothetical protein
VNFKATSNVVLCGAIVASQIYSKFSSSMAGDAYLHWRGKTLAMEIKWSSAIVV